MSSVSVVVLVHHGGEGLSDTMDCLLSQTMADELQVVLVDDGSAEVATKRLVRAHRTVARVTGAGASGLNAGLALASGDYVAFLDCGDLVDVTAYEVLADLAEREDADVAYCGELVTEPTGTLSRDNARRPHVSSPVWRDPMLLRSCSQDLWNKIFSRGLIEGYELRFDESLGGCEDLEFTLRALACARSVAHDRRILAVHEMNPNCTCELDRPDRRAALARALGSAIALYRERGLFLHVEDELLHLVLEGLYGIVEDGSAGRLRGAEARLAVGACLDLLDRDFPWWRKYDSFFKQTGRPRALSTSRPLLMAASSLPAAARRRLGRGKARRPEDEHTSKPGAVYAEKVVSADVEDGLVVIDPRCGTALVPTMARMLEAVAGEGAPKGLRLCVGAHGRGDVKALKTAVAHAGIDVSAVKFCLRHSSTYAEKLACAQLVISDEALPPYYVPREGQVHVELRGFASERGAVDEDSDEVSLAENTRSLSCADVVVVPAAAVDVTRTNFSAHEVTEWDGSSSSAHWLVTSWLADGTLSAHPAAEERDLLVCCCGLSRPRIARGLVSLLGNVGEHTDVSLAYHEDATTNLTLLEGVDERVQLAPVTRAFTSLDARGQRLLARVKAHPETSAGHEEELMRMAALEAARAWPRASFRWCIAYGLDSLESLLAASSVARVGVLVLVDELDVRVAAEVPAWVLERFEFLVVPEDVDVCGLPDARVVRCDVSSLGDLVRIADSVAG